MNLVFFIAFHILGDKTEIQARYEMINGDNFSFDNNSVHFVSNNEKCVPPKDWIEPSEERKFQYEEKDIIFSQPIKYHIDLSDRHNLLYFENPEKVRFDTPFFVKYIEETNSTYYVLKNCYVNRLGGIVMNNDTFYQVPGPNSQTAAHPGRVVGCYDSVISLSSRFSLMFGHWMKDTLAPLFLLPEKVLNTSMLLISAYPSFSLETLEILGFDTNRTILLPHFADYIFAKEVHTIAGEQSFLCHFGIPLINLSKRFRKALNLSNEKPNRYTMFNRPEGKFRRIVNFDDLVIAVKKIYFEKSWEIWPSTFESTKMAAKHWNEAILVFSPTGSNIDNAIFMQKGSALCTPCADWYDFAVVGVSQVIGLWHVIYSVEEWDHFGDCSAPIDIDLSIEMIGRAIYAAENQKWPVI